MTDLCDCKFHIATGRQCGSILCECSNKKRHIYKSDKNLCYVCLKRGNLQGSLHYMPKHKTCEGRSKITFKDNTLEIKGDPSVAYRYEDGVSMADAYEDACKQYYYETVCAFLLDELPDRKRDIDYFYYNLRDYHEKVVPQCRYCSRRGTTASRSHSYCDKHGRANFEVVEELSGRRRTVKTFQTFKRAKYYIEKMYKEWTVYETGEFYMRLSQDTRTSVYINKVST